MKTIEKKNKTDRVTEIAYVDDGSKPMLNDCGVAKKTLAYDANGNVIEERFYGVAGEPVLRKVCRCARTARSHHVTDEGRVVEERYYGLSGEPVTDAYGCAGRVWLYDIRGCNYEHRCFGLAEELVTHRLYGYARAVRTFDDKGRIVKERYLGPDGEPVVCRVHGFAMVTCTCDEHGAVKKLYHRSPHSKGVAMDNATLDKMARECKMVAVGMERES